MSFVSKLYGKFLPFLFIHELLKTLHFMNDLFKVYGLQKNKLVERFFFFFFFKGCNIFNNLENKKEFENFFLNERYANFRHKINVFFFYIFILVER